MEPHHEYRFADPERRDDDAAIGFAVTRRPTPAGWRRLEEGARVALHPSGTQLLAEGWKIHVSARLANAEDVLDIVWSHCVARQIAFTFVRSPHLLSASDSTDADAAASVRLLTLDPVGDAEVERTLTDLAIALDGQHGSCALGNCSTSPSHACEMHDPGERHETMLTPLPQLPALRRPCSDTCSRGRCPQCLGRWRVRQARGAARR